MPEVSSAPPVGSAAEDRHVARIEGLWVDVRPAEVRAWPERRPVFLPELVRIRSFDRVILTG